MLSNAKHKIPYLENNTFKDCLEEITKKLKAREPAVCLTDCRIKTRCANEIIKVLKADVILKSAYLSGHLIPYQPISDAFSDYRLELAIDDATEWNTAIQRTAGSLMNIIPLPGIISE